MIKPEHVEPKYRVQAAAAERGTMELHDAFDPLDPWVIEYHEKFILLSGDSMHHGWTIRPSFTEAFMWVEIDPAPYVASGFQFRWQLMTRLNDLQLMKWNENLQLWTKNLTTADLVAEVYRIKSQGEARPL